MKGGMSQILAVLFVCSHVVGQAGAGVIFSNLGPAMEFDTAPTHGWTINGFLREDIGQQTIGHRFTPAATDTFTSAQVVLSHFSGPNILTVSLQADSNGRPGAVIEEIDVAGLTEVPTIFTAMSVLHPELQGGTPYWLVVVAGEPGVVAGWHWNSIGDASTGSNFAVNQFGSQAGPWSLDNLGSTRSAFQINGSPPTPQEALELLMGQVEVLLQAGAFTQGQANGLLAKLGAAFASLSRENSRAACNQLRAFINQVNALINAGNLLEENGEDLINAAEAIRDQVCF